MARIVLGYDVDTPHDRMNAEEMGRLMSVINAFLDTHFLEPETAQPCASNIGLASAWQTWKR